MKVTRLGVTRAPTGSGLSGAGGDITSPATNSGFAPIADGSNSWAWGSNVGTIWSNGSNLLLGPSINIASGANIALSASSNTLTIIGLGSGGGGGGGAPTDAKYVVSAANSNLSAEVVIPGLAGSADVAAGGGSDDEFDTTDASDPITGWTTLGSPTVHDTNSTWKSHYYIKEAAAAGVSLNGIYKGWTPSAGATVSCRLSDAVIRTNNNLAGLFIAEASPGKIMAIQFISYSGTRDRRIGSYNYTNRTTFASENTVGGFAGPFGMPLYFRMTYNSSTSVDLWYSLNGQLWWIYQAAVNPGFTVGAAGLFVDCNSATSDVEATFDWIRFT